MKIYLVGIGGVGMANLANLLQQVGHQVVGSDNAVYPPISDFLSSQAVDYRLGYAAKNLPEDVELAVVGNVVKKNNIEVEAMIQRQIPMLSMPQAIQRFLLAEREATVVAGTHGKTTVAAMLAHCLTVAGRAPGFFIGGIANNFMSGSALGTGRDFVLEGDEYDSAFFHKVPKFLSYQPKRLVLTSLEFDHADIYTDLDEISLEFSKLVELVPTSGCIVFYGGSKRLRQVVQKAKCRIYSYGDSSESDFFYRNVEYASEALHMDFSVQVAASGKQLCCSLASVGEQNVLNATAVVALLEHLGVDHKMIGEGLKSFLGVQRRQQTLWCDAHSLVIEDFAHHPTAIRQTLRGLRRAFPEHQLWVLFEPRSNTTRRNHFQKTLPEALSIADVVVLYKVYQQETIPAGQRLDRSQVKSAVEKQQRRCYLADSVESIIRLVKEQEQKRRLVVVMSNGDFDGLKQQLVTCFG